MPQPNTPHTYAVNMAWRIILEDLKIRPSDLLRRAALPEDLFARDNARLSSAEYFRLWRAFEEEAEDPLLPLKIGRQITAEAFDPPIFAALCSQNLRLAIRRLARFKRLLAPMELRLTEGATDTRLDIEWLDKSLDPPPLFVATDLVFFVQLARLATRHPIQPLLVTTTVLPPSASAYREYFGVDFQQAEHHSLVFRRADAERPFLTANESLWTFFEPELRRRLSELDASASMTDRVRAALLELLPAGDASMNAVCGKLAMSRRTLQRRLSGEETSFQRILDLTREDLARHYLRSTSLSGAEISYLLGFDDANSFFRAFHAWTGQTPETARRDLQTAN